MKKIINLLFFMLLSVSAFADSGNINGVLIATGIQIPSGNIGFGTNTPLTILDLSSTTSALRVTRLSNASTITSRNGMIAYDSTQNQLQAYVNGTWVDLGANSIDAPTTADYIVGTANGSLSAEQSLGALTTGLVLNTVSGSTGTVSIYGGTSCTNQFPRSLNASGSATCATVGTGDVASGITLDTEWDTVGEIETATGVNLITATEIDTSSEVAGIVGDETGTGSLVFSASPRLTGNVGIGATANPLALLDLSSTNNALRVTRLSNASTITSRNGMIAYDSIQNQLQGYINGTWVDLGANSIDAPTDATYITQTSNSTLSAEQALSSLSSGIMRVANGTGVITSLTDSSGLATNISDETGSGSLVFSAAPKLTGNVGIGATANPLALLDLSSTTNAMRVTRLSNASTIISRNGMIAYDSTENQLQSYINGTWVNLGTTDAPTNATYITQTSNSTLSAEQALSSLSSGIMRVNNSDGVVTSLTNSSGIATNISDETGTGNLVFSASPILTGNVGIGMTASGVLLELSAATVDGSALAITRNFGRVGIGTTVINALLELSSSTSTGVALTVTQGNVGVGTSAPAQKLDVSGTSKATTFTDGTASLTGGSLTSVKLGTLTNNGFVKTSSGDGSLSVDTTSYQATLSNYVATVADGTGIDGTASGAGSTYTPTLDLTEISSTTWGAGAFTTETFDAGATDPVFTFASNKFGITGADNVGIGTTTPRGLLELSSTTNATKLVMASGKVGIGYTAPGNSLVVNGNVGIGNSIPVNSLIVASGNVGIGYTVPAGALAVNGNVGIGVSAPKVILQLSAGLAATTVLTTSENFGRVGIGTSTPRALLELSGTALGLKFYVPSGNVGIGTSTVGFLLELSANTDTTVLRINDSNGNCSHNPGTSSEAVTCNSDARLKKDIRDTTSSLNEILKYRVRDYNLKSDNKMETGVIAQEVMQTNPAVVSFDEETGFYAVREPNPWKIIKAIQEQQKMIEQLKHEIYLLKQNK